MGLSIAAAAAQKQRWLIRLAHLLSVEHNSSNFVLALNEHIISSSSLLRGAMAYSPPCKSLEAAG